MYHILVTVIPVHNLCMLQLVSICSLLSIPLFFPFNLGRLFAAPFLMSYFLSLTSSPFFDANCPSHSLWSHLFIIISLSSILCRPLLMAISLLPFLRPYFSSIFLRHHLFILIFSSPLLFANSLWRLLAPFGRRHSLVSIITSRVILLFSLSPM